MAVPKLRFKGAFNENGEWIEFTDDWEQRKLGEVGVAKSGIGFPNAEQGGTKGVPFFKVSDMNTEGNENELVVANNYVTDEQIARKRWTVIDEVPAIFFAKVGAAVMLNRKRLVRLPFLLDNNTMAYIFDKNVWNCEFGKTLFETIDLTKLTQVGALPSYNASDVEEVKICIPQKKEQEVIGRYFKNLDHLITLHQREFEKLQDLKKAMLQKMFPRNGTRVPEVRFPGFTDDWEQRKLGDTFDIMQNNALSRSDLSSADGDVMNVHYGDVLVKYGEVLDVKKDEMTYLLDASLVNKYLASLLQNGDIIIADTAEDETVGKCSEIAGLTDEKVLSGLHTIPCRPRGNFAEGYLGYYMNSGSYHDQLLPLIQGTKVSSISKSAIQDTDIMYPKSETEQRRIGYYFRNLDHLITLHQRECDLYKLLKKGFLQQMFV